jgi:DNA-binding transcriptional MerR regulator
MAHEIAKLLLEHAETFLGRTEAIETALSLGMPLQEIETYLDWLDQMQVVRKRSESPENPPSRKIEGAEST